MTAGHILGPNAYEWCGTWYRDTLPSSETGGRLSIIESLSPPGGGPPRHVHEGEDECHYILSGEMEWWRDGETGRAGPAQAVFIPRGHEHSYRVIGSRPCRHLLVLTPGGFEGFLQEISRSALRYPEDLEEMQRVAARYRLKITGPPV